MTLRKDPRSPYWHYDFHRQRVRYYGSTDCTDRTAAAKFEAALKAEVGNNEAQRIAPTDPSRGQAVYFIGAGADGPVKIGLAVNPAARLSAVQVFNHERLVLLGTALGGRAQETAYHARFAAHRLHGEWFARHDDILAEIAHLNQTAECAA